MSVFAFVFLVPHAHRVSVCGTATACLRKFMKLS